jgi:hypothetical protein
MPTKKKTSKESDKEPVEKKEKGSSPQKKGEVPSLRQEPKRETGTSQARRLQTQIK